MMRLRLVDWAVGAHRRGTSGRRLFVVGHAMGFLTAIAAADKNRRFAPSGDPYHVVEIRRCPPSNGALSKASRSRRSPATTSKSETKR